MGWGANGGIYLWGWVLLGGIYLWGGVPSGGRTGESPLDPGVSWVGVTFPESYVKMFPSSLLVGVMRPLSYRKMGSSRRGGVTPGEW